MRHLRSWVPVVCILALATSTAGLALAKSTKPTHPKAVVQVSSNKTLGKFLVTKRGYTLYHLVLENNGRATCTGKCLKLWRPYLLKKGQALTAGPGVTDKLSTRHRKHIGRQVEYDGWLLYRFVGDTKPGQTFGQGYPNNGHQYWFVVSPQPTVNFTVHIGSAGGAVVYGTVTLGWTYQKKSMSKSCSQASCVIAVNADQKVVASETPTNSTAAPFGSWTYGPVHTSAKLKRSTKAKINVVSHDDFTINANYSPVA